MERSGSKGMDGICYSWPCCGWCLLQSCHYIVDTEGDDTLYTGDREGALKSMWLWLPLLVLAVITEPLYGLFRKGKGGK